MFLYCVYVGHGSFIHQVQHGRPNVLASQWLSGMLLPPTSSSTLSTLMLSEFTTPGSNVTVVQGFWVSEGQLRAVFTRGGVQIKYTKLDNYSYRFDESWILLLLIVQCEDPHRWIVEAATAHPKTWNYAGKVVPFLTSPPPSPSNFRATNQTPPSTFLVNFPSSYGKSCRRSWRNPSLSCM